MQQGTGDSRSLQEAQLSISLSSNGKKPAQGQQTVN